MTRLSNLLFISMCLLPALANAGHWANGAGQCLDAAGQATSCKWGQMYWGGGQTYSAPTEAPQIDAVVDGTDVSGSLTNLSGSGDDGWSAITQFIINCGDQDVVVTAQALASGSAILTDLEASTNYTCSVVAVNDLGESDTAQFSFTTDAMGGLPIWLLYQATQQT